MNAQKNIWIGVIVFLVFGGSAWYYLSGGSANKTAPENTAIATSTTPIASTTAPTTSPDKGSVVGVALPNGEVVSAPVAGIPAPSLDRPITIAADLTADQKIQMTQEIQKLSAELKDNDNLMHVWTVLGTYRENIGDFAGAEEIWTYVTKKWPTDPVAYSNLGNMYRYHLKEYQKSEQSFLGAIKAQPTFTDAYLSLHELYLSGLVGTKSDARSILLQGIKANPGNTQFMVMLADDYKAAGDTDKARTYLNQALSVAQNAGDTEMVSSIQGELNTL